MSLRSERCLTIFFTATTNRKNEHSYTPLAMNASTHSLAYILANVAPIDTRVAITLVFNPYDAALIDCVRSFLWREDYATATHDGLVLSIPMWTILHFLRASQTEPTSPTDPLHLSITESS